MEETRSEKRKKSRNKKRRRIYTVILVIAILAFCFAGYQIISILTEYGAGDSDYHDLEKYGPKQDIVLPTPSIGPEQSMEPELSENDAWLDAMLQGNAAKVDFQGLQQINADIKAWIIIKDTVINYPVVQTADNQYYTEYTAKHQHNKVGAIFMDYRNDPNFLDANTVLYGHNMKNGSMFHTLPQYQKQDYFDSHCVGLLITPEKTYELRFFSAYIIGAKEPYWTTDFSDEEEYAKFLRTAQKNSMVKSDVEVGTKDRIVTLSTCTYEFEDARFVLHAKLVER